MKGVATDGKICKGRKRHASVQRLRDDGLYCCRTCGVDKSRTLEFFGSDPRVQDKLRAMCRVCAVKASVRSHMNGRYGTTPEAVAATLSQQGHCCALCGVPLDSSTKVRKPHVDHDHVTGRMRAVLCHHCNVFLGHAASDAALLRKAADYLDQHCAEPVCRRA